jgi:hypothetical protein
VAEALMDRLGARQTIYCPAFPENGRSIYMGNLFVGDVPLAESPMKDHPLTPMRDSNLMRLLAPQVTGKVGHVPWQVVSQGSDACAPGWTNWPLLAWRTWCRTRSGRMTCRHCRSGDRTSSPGDRRKCLGAGHAPLMEARGLVEPAARRH